MQVAVSKYLNDVWKPFFVNMWLLLYYLVHQNTWVISVNWRITCLKPVFEYEKIVNKTVFNFFTLPTVTREHKMGPIIKYSQYFEQ